jgi:parvulin-like peptidyl-prolyl isomerase
MNDLNSVLSVGDQSLLIRELVIDHAIASLQLTPEEESSIAAQVNAASQSSPLGIPSGLASTNGVRSPQALEEQLRRTRIEKFKQQTWGKQIESYFLKRKTQLDKAIYYLLRTQDRGLAQELYFRLKEGEQPFAELAPLFSQGPETQSKGLIGPVEMGKLHNTLAQHLSSAQPGQLFPPLRLGDWWVIVQLEQWQPARLDDETRQRLLNELFEQWLQEQLQVYQ